MKNYEAKGLLGVCVELKNNNYGSMLQSFATQRMLQGYGFGYELLVYRKQYTCGFILKSLPRLLNRVVWQDKLAERKKRKFLRAHPQLKECVQSRAKAFDAFRAMYFTAPRRVSYGYAALVKDSRRYRAFLTGSDQLWSPSGLPTNFYNLMFAHEQAVKISFASSFGVKSIPWYQRARTRRYLNRIACISCREESGARIVKELTGRNVPVVADPTMLFTAEEWAEMLPCERVREGQYIFAYLLGTDRACRDEVAKLSRQTGLPIVSIHQYVDADLGFGDVSVEDAGPREFVDLIRHAAYVCTDSFHGAVFAILHHRKFVVFNRYAETSRASKNTRVESLVNRLGLAARRSSGDIAADMTPDIDFDSVDATLDAIRAETRQYLESAFDAIP